MGVLSLKERDIKVNEGVYIFIFIHMYVYFLFPHLINFVQAWSVENHCELNVSGLIYGEGVAEEPSGFLLKISIPIYRKM